MKNSLPVLSSEDICMRSCIRWMRVCIMGGGPVCQCAVGCGGLWRSLGLQFHGIAMFNMWLESEQKTRATTTRTSITTQSTRQRTPTRTRTQTPRQQQRNSRAANLSMKNFLRSFINSTVHSWHSIHSELCCFLHSSIHRRCLYFPLFRALTDSLALLHWTRLNSALCRVNCRCDTYTNTPLCQYYIPGPFAPLHCSLMTNAGVKSRAQEDTFGATWRYSL